MSTGSFAYIFAAGLVVGTATGSAWEKKHHHNEIMVVISESQQPSIAPRDGDRITWYPSLNGKIGDPADVVVNFRGADKTPSPCEGATFETNNNPCKLVKGFDSSVFHYKCLTTNCIDPDFGPINPTGVGLNGMKLTAQGMGAPTPAAAVEVEVQCDPTSKGTSLYDTNGNVVAAGNPTSVAAGQTILFLPSGSGALTFTLPTPSPCTNTPTTSCVVQPGAASGNSYSFVIKGAACKDPASPFGATEYFKIQ